MFGAAVGAVDPSFVGSQVVIVELSVGCTGASRQTVVAGRVWLSAVVAAGAPEGGKRSRQQDSAYMYYRRTMCRILIARYLVQRVRIESAPIKQECHILQASTA